MQDHLRSTSALTNSSGALVSQSQYEAFGASASSSLTRYGYTGRELDSLTGLMHYRARWYDPQQGRFMSEDPIGFDGGLNLYGYVGNNPMMYTDPSGQIAFLPILAAAGASFVVGFTLSTLFGQCYGWKDVLTDWAIDAATFGAFKGVKWLAKAMGRAPKARNLMKSMRPQLMKGIERGGGRFGRRLLSGADDVISRGSPRVGSGGGDITPAQIERTINHGEKVSDLVQELAQRTYETGGLEHAIVSVNGGQRVLVSGGTGGIDFGGLDIHRVIIHTHPTPTGPSSTDFLMLQQTGQRSSYVYELFGGGLTKFFRGF